MSSDEIRQFLQRFPSAIATLLWNFSEAAGIPLGDSAPLIFGLMIDSPPINVEAER